MSELSAAGAELLVVGAFAVAAHGNPRSTGDIDIWVRSTRENAERVLRALRAFGAPLFDLVAELDLDMIEEVRRTWQFDRDRRPDAYGSLVED